jgi:hypothetical protein
MGYLIAEKDAGGISNGLSHCRKGCRGDLQWVISLQKRKGPDHNLPFIFLFFVDIENIYIKQKRKVDEVPVFPKIFPKKSQKKI